MALTRAQARRAVMWEEYLAVPRRKRGAPPPCVTCGAGPDYTEKGEPHYTCRHEPMRIDAETMARAREAFPAEAKSV